MSLNSGSSSSTIFKSFSVGEFFKMSLEQYLLLRSSLLLQTLEGVNSLNKRIAFQEFMNEFVAFGKLVMTKNLKHYQTIIADIIERNLIFDFSDLKTRGEEGLHPNRTLKTMLLSLDKMDLHLVQLQARLLCLRLMYEHLSQAEKVPKGANYREKFNENLNKHLDQIKVLGRMNEGDGEILIMGTMKSLLNGCNSIEFYKYLLILCNKNQLQKETKKFIKQEYQNLIQKYSVRQQPDNPAAAAVVDEKSQQPAFEGSNDNNNNNNNAEENNQSQHQQQPELQEFSYNNIDKRKLFTALFVKKTNPENLIMNSDTKFNRNIPCNANVNDAPPFIEEEQSSYNTPQNTQNNLSNNNQQFCEQTNHIPKLNVLNQQKNNLSKQGDTIKSISSITNHNNVQDGIHQSHHHEECTQFNLLNIATSHPMQNNSKSIDFKINKPFTNNDDLKYHNQSKGAAAQASLPIQAGNPAALKVLNSNIQRSLTKPIQSGRTMYSQNKVVRNSQPKINAQSANKSNSNNQRKSQSDHHNKDTNNILFEAAQKLLQEIDLRKQNQTKMMGREPCNSSARKLTRSQQKQLDQDLIEEISQQQITEGEQGSSSKKKNQTRAAAAIKNNNQNFIQNGDEKSLPLMYMWGHS